MDHYFFEHIDHDENLENETENIKYLSLNFTNVNESSFEKFLNQISSHLNILAKNVQHDKIENMIEKKWRFAALVLDKLFFILSTIFVIIIFVTLNLASSNFYGFS